MGVVLSFVLFLVLVAGVVLTVRNLNKPKNKPARERSLKNVILYPSNALEKGASDMFKAIFREVYSFDIKLELFYFDKNSYEMLNNISERICGDKLTEENYISFNFNKGRTSRKYLASESSNDFEQYVLGGRQVIDLIDKELARIKEEKRLERARLEALGDSDRFHKETRKAQRGLQDPSEELLSRLEKFERDMKEIENDKD